MAAKHSPLHDDKALLPALSVRWRTLRSQPVALRVARTGPTSVGALSDRQRGATHLALIDRAVAACCRNSARRFAAFSLPFFLSSFLRFFLSSFLPFGPGAERPESFIATPVNDAPSWSTSTFSNSADSSPMELSALGEHLGHCLGAHGRLFNLQCVAETLDGFVSARLVTSLVVVALLIGIASLVS
jgi:hypothetical protein